MNTFGMYLGLNIDYFMNASTNVTTNTTVLLPILLPYKNHTHLPQFRLMEI